jgi:hypothetical protein
MWQPAVDFDHVAAVVHEEDPEGIRTHRAEALGRLQPLTGPRSAVRVGREPAVRGEGWCAGGVDKDGYPLVKCLPSLPVQADDGLLIAVCAGVCRGSGPHRLPAWPQNGPQLNFHGEMPRP